MNQCTRCSSCCLNSDLSLLALRPTTTMLSTNSQTILKLGRIAGQFYVSGVNGRELSTQPWTEPVLRGILKGLWSLKLCGLLLKKSWVQFHRGSGQVCAVCVSGSLV